MGYFVFLLVVVTILVADRIYQKGDHPIPNQRAAVQRIDPKLDARRLNEGLKLSATFANNLAVGVVVAGVIAPSTAKQPITPEWLSSLFLISLSLHFFGRLLLQWMVSED